MGAPRSYLVITSPDAPIREMDTFTCAHCQRIVPITPRCAPSDAGGWCARCAKCVCGPCADRGRCDPFEKKLERAERRSETLRSMGF